MPSILAPIPHGGHQCYNGQNSTSDYSSPNFSSSARAPLSQNSHRRPLLISETNSRSLQAQLPQRHQTAELHFVTDARALHPPSRPILRSSRGRPPLPKRSEISNSISRSMQVWCFLQADNCLHPAQVNHHCQRVLAGELVAQTLSPLKFHWQPKHHLQTPISNAPILRVHTPLFPLEECGSVRCAHSQLGSGFEPHRFQKPLSSASYSQTAASVKSHILSSETSSFENQEWLDYLVSLRKLPDELKLAKTRQQMDVLICKMHQDALSRTVDRS